MSDSTDDCQRISSDCPVEATIYGYAPNAGANGFYAAIFTICCLAQFYFLFKYWRFWKGYTVLVFIGCAGECCGYVGRILLNNNPWDGAAMTIQLLLIMVSPSFLAAALYMTLRGLVEYFGPRHSKLPVRLWTWPFVTADFIGFVSQCGGGIVASMGDKKNSLATVGNAMMIGGVTFQAVVMIIAGALATDFALRMRRERKKHVFMRLPKAFKIFLLSLITAFMVILTRCIYRVPEMAGGVGGPLMRKEADFMIFDGLMIVISVVLLTAVHPGVFASVTHEHVVYTRKQKASPETAENEDGELGVL